MIELDYFTASDNSIISLQREAEGVYSVTCYDKNDHQQWTVEYDSLSSAERQFEKLRNEDAEGQKEGKGAA